MDAKMKVSRLATMSYGEGQFDSGANPDFKVTSASRAAREMDRLLQTLAAKSDSLDKKMRGLLAAQKLRDENPSNSAPEPILIESPDPEPVEPVKEAPAALDKAAK